MSTRLLFKWIGLALIVFILWFVPWVFVLHTGFLVYFPYHKDSKSRFVRFAHSLSSDQIPKSCKRALVATEDANFYEHNGVDLESLELAYKRNERRRKIRFGGSTITQQLVKNAFLSRTRSYVRKAREIVGSIILDAIMSKDSQLNWYLSVVEFGPEIYGLEDAARYYFKKPIKKLNATECVNLMSVLPYPVRYYRTVTGSNVPRFLQAKRARIRAAL